MFPPVGLLNILPQLPNLRQPSPALREEVVAGLLLSPPAPPASVVIRLLDGVPEVWAHRRVARESLVISAGDVLWCPSKEPAPDAPAQWDSVSAAGAPEALRDPLVHPAQSALGGDSCHVTGWSHLSSSGTALPGLMPLTASLAYSSVFLFPVTSWWA